MKLESRDGEGQRLLNTSVNESEKQIERWKDLRERWVRQGKTWVGLPRFLRRGRLRNRRVRKRNRPEDGLFEPSNNK